MNNTKTCGKDTLKSVPGRKFMFTHNKNLLEMVRVERPNPQYAAMLQEQLGGPQGELKAALQYISQSFA